MSIFRVPDRIDLKQALSRNLPAGICAAVLAFSLWSAIRTEALPPEVQEVDAEMTLTETFESLRTEREQMRQLCFSQLMALIPEDGVGGEAESALIALTDVAMQEENIRSVLLARGYEDVLVTVEDNSVNVLVRGEVAEEDAAVILELVVRETGQDPGAVKIIALN